MERCIERDQRVTLRIAVGEVIAPRGLDRALDRFRTRIGEEHGVRKRVVDEALREVLALRRSVQVRHMHQRRRLIRDRLGQVRMRVAERVDGDTAREIEILLAVLAEEVRALASDRTHATPRVDGHERGDGHDGKLLQTARATLIGRPNRLIRVRDARGNTASRRPPAARSAKPSGCHSTSCGTSINRRMIFLTWCQDPVRFGSIRITPPQHRGNNHV